MVPLSKSFAHRLCVAVTVMGATSVSSGTIVWAQDTSSAVTFTWLTNTSWLIEAGETTVLFDGAISRPAMRAPNLNDRETLFPPPVQPDEASVRRVYDALQLPSGIDAIIIGHAHIDHSIDTAVWARLTGANIIGSRTACYQAFAQGIPESRCRVVEGGEVLQLGPRLRARVVRWHHSGNLTNPLRRLIQTPLELRSVPVPDSATGGLRPSGFEDFPNGGGSRAVLFTYESAAGPLRWFISNTGNEATFDAPAEGRASWFAELGIPLDNLEIIRETVSTREYLDRVLAAEGVDRVALWLGYWLPAHVAQVVPVLRPDAFIPHHWGGFRSIFEGVPRPLTNASLTEVLESSGIDLLIQPDFGARFRLDSSGIRDISSDSLRARLGIVR